jgi:glycosyltransferase involved in cell wall biosynthesis
VSGLRALLSPFPYVTAKFGSAQVRRAIRAILEREQFDLIIAHVNVMAQSVPTEFAMKTPVVLDELESEGLLWRQYLRQGNVAMKGFALVNLLKLARFQRRIAARIAALICVSDREREFARSFIPEHVGLWTVPNGVDADSYNSLLMVRRDTNAIILCGFWGVYRNEQAALWFGQRVFPKIREKIPDAELWVVGAGPTRAVRALGKSSAIHVTGTVDDVRPYYQKAAVSVAPYRFGEGTKLKVLEAMASGVPLVATRVGCQGVDVVDGEQVLIVDGEEEFAQHVVRILRDPSRRARLADAARRLVERKYTWKKIVGDLEPKLVDLASRER